MMHDPDQGPVQTSQLMINLIFVLVNIMWIDKFRMGLQEDDKRITTVDLIIICFLAK